MNDVHIEEAYTIISDHLFNTSNGSVPALIIENLTYEASKQLEEDGYELFFMDSWDLMYGYMVIFK